MTKPLKIQNRFIPCSIDDGDEFFANGIFVFNITKMIDYIQNNLKDIALTKVAVGDYSQAPSSIDESHLDTVEIGRPVILAEIVPGRYNLIDGHHRIEKARRMGIDSIQAYKMTVKYHMKFLTDKKAYATYIKYWNSKLK